MLAMRKNAKFLRTAFEDLLPAEIVWRDKAQFDEGTGATDFLSSRALERDKVAESTATWPGPQPRTPEERHYRDLLAGAFSDPAPVLATVTRWEGSHY